MTNEVKVVSVPPLWVRPAAESFESAKASFLGDEEYDQFKAEEKNSEDPVF